MKAIEISEASNPLSDYADELDEGMILLTSNKKPIAALVSLKNADQESLALGMNPEFIKIIETAREEFKAGKKLSLEEMRREILG
ncbi:type II toxin-antitoxin system Phd/YefM family antitoxin [Candidatus Thiosymbion oneisti]|uniref:type II toxin-antitoxin system Phd/YefM family antitoxin n=1 Tax=Candidatus Thiosymbion oneisti TaxID=589554 RepID=UPI000B7E6F90|nr:type II toxin-antitoxin system Phd/YefM family antitoxin [Candidatus Thiosymbion oneisti]